MREHNIALLINLPGLTSDPYISMPRPIPMVTVPSRRSCGTKLGVGNSASWQPPRTYTEHRVCINTNCRHRFACVLQSLDLNLQDSSSFHRNGAKFSSFRKKPTSSRSFRNRVSRSLYNSTASSGPASVGDASQVPTVDQQMISSTSLPVFISPATTPGYNKQPTHTTPLSASAPVKNKSKYCRILW